MPKTLMAIKYIMSLVSHTPLEIELKCEEILIKSKILPEIPVKEFPKISKIIWKNIPINSASKNDTI